MNMSNITKEEASGASEIELSPVSKHEHTMNANRNARFARNVVLEMEELSRQRRAHPEPGRSTRE